ncbi:MAG TPA: response regulator [Rhodocyclaceae bacterium]
MNSERFRRILVVDDEPSIVNAVRREVCTPPLGRYSYDVEGFTDPAQALERARSQSFDAVICDYRMPGMTGIEFLKALTAIQPDCARLVLSGQTDMAGLVAMVNETHIYRFIPKPWHDYYLKSSLAQAIEFAGALRESRRLAGLVREHGIAVPPLVPDAGDEILIVDDDPAVASSLARLLSSHTETDDLYAAIRAEIGHRPGGRLDEAHSRIATARSGREALKAAAARTFSCIVADFRMPDINGIELLQQFADIQPDCARILISGHVAQDDLVAAVDAAHIFGFIAKPWQDYEVKSCVAQALASRRVALENRMLADMVRRAGGTSA